MKIFVATDVNIIIHDGKIYASQKHSTILERYYNAFGRIVLCARFGVANSNVSSYDEITNIVDSIVEVQSLHRMFLGKCNSKIASAMKDCDLVICRCPAISAFKTADIARALGKPYLAESMGDPWDAYWNHGVQGKSIALYMYLKMKNVVWNANYAVYVTKEYLQSHYPCKNKSIAASNVLIEEGSEFILDSRLNRIKKFNSKKITLMTTAAIDVWYKGQLYVIKAIPMLNKAGIFVKYRVVGEGNSSFLKEIAKKSGVLDQVEFLGKRPLSEVLGLLDETDVYLQPSLQEGLPRSVIEAMSRGCACIGTKTAGIPELLEKGMVVKRKSVGDIADCLIKYVKLDEQEKCAIASRNFQEAKKYSKNHLDFIRNEYYKKIKRDILER